MTDRSTAKTTAGKPPVPGPDVPGDPTPAPKPIPDTPGQPTPEPTPDLPPAAQRALAEAEERRRAAAALELPPELGGRDGPEPVRYGDWEKKGLAIDF
ncbi:DUF1674 domain-containing protein [uncultured Roseobacter sp.]|uniref:DUF1674 domain-containing protein n=1 Tax=uncultured Roseobacter sp. TaxID=114847 RepID=UPI0034545754